MGLFQRNPYHSSEHQALYTLGQHKAVLIIGLGNKGKKYDSTRHNIGFSSVDAFANAHEFGSWIEKKTLKSLVTTQTLGDTRVILAKPTTYMNLSGEAGLAISKFYKIPTSQIIAVYDELDIPFGQVRTRQGGSSAGHNGVKSLIAALGEDFGRLRIGIKNDNLAKIDSADFVLAKFSKEEQKQIASLLKEVTSVLTEYVYTGELPEDTRNFLI